MQQLAYTAVLPVNVTSIYPSGSLTADMSSQGGGNRGPVYQAIGSILQIHSC